MTCDSHVTFASVSAMVAGSVPWVEKYRPRKVSDVSHQEEVVATLQQAVDDGSARGNLPHLLLYGPPGTGKTSTALALCHQLYGKANYKARVLELNASDERGIRVVRDKIKIFAQQTVGLARDVVVDGVRKACPPFKIVILDEADAITTDAQTALRRTMEAHSRITRFILICNYVSKIIAPLASRCSKFRFNALPMKAMVDRLRFVSVNEKVSVSDDTLLSLVEAADGDLRRAITTLQSAHQMNAEGDELTEEAVVEAACLVPESTVENFDKMTADEKTGFNQVRQVVDDIVNDGYSGAQLMNQYSARLFGSREQGVGAMQDLQKAVVAIALAEADSCLTDCADEHLQLQNLASRIATVARNADNLEALKAC